MGCPSHLPTTIVILSAAKDLLFVPNSGSELIDGLRTARRCCITSSEQRQGPDFRRVESGTDETNTALPKARAQPVEALKSFFCEQLSDEERQVQRPERL